MSLVKSLFESVVRKSAHEQTAGRGLISFGVGLVATRIATRSVPGAIAVGAALLGKHFWDKKQEESGKVNTAKEMVDANPKIAADIARENPAAMTDDYDDVDLKQEIKERKKRNGAVSATH